MAELTGVEFLKALFAEEVEKAPRQHPLHTPRCPPLVEFPRGVREGWTPAEREHVRGCPYCQMVTAMEWAEECPSPLKVLRYAANPAEFADRVAMEEHLKSGGCRCQLVMQSPIVELARAWRSASGVAAAAGRRLTEVGSLEGFLAGLAVATGERVHVGQFAGTTERPFRLRAKSEDGQLRATLWENAGALLVWVESEDRRNAGRSVHVDVAGTAGNPLSVELVLENLGEGLGCRGEHSFGPIEGFGPLLRECVLTATWAERSPAGGGG